MWKWEWLTPVNYKKKITSGLIFIFFKMYLFVSYRDPERGWDRSKVKGLLANLISVRDVSYATALEVVAGGRLYNIVVDTEVGVCV